MLTPAYNIVAIVPAYNEVATVQSVVCTLISSDLFADVVVIDDGSNDGTAEMAASAGATVLRSPYNMGKAQAMLHAVDHTNSQYVMFCDADLIGLTVAHVRSLVVPVINRRCDMTVGLRDRGAVVNGAMHYLPLIGGERVVRRDVLATIPREKFTGFGAEIMINAAHRTHKMYVQRVLLPKLSSVL